MKRRNLGEFFAIDKHAYNSSLNDWNTTFKVSFLLIVLLLDILLNNIFCSIIIIVCMGYLTIVKGKIKIGEYVRFLLIPSTFIFLSSITIAFDFSITEVGIYSVNFGIFYIYTTLDKMKFAIFLSLKALAAISVVLTLTLSTPSGELINFMRKAHVPKLIIELMNLVYRYIFILIDIYNQMKVAATSRMGYCDYKTSLLTFSKIMSSLLVVSLMKANQHYDALESRSYDGEIIFLKTQEEVKYSQIGFAGVFICWLLVTWFLTK